MSDKPDNIPQDIWDAADRAWSGGEWFHLSEVEVCAHALMAERLAERERCALVVENYAKQFPVYPEFDEAHNTGMALATAIRNPEPAP